MAAKKCHWRVSTSGRDYYGGKTKAQAQAKRRRLGKGRVVRYCVKPGGREYKTMSPLLQWGIIGGVVAGGVYLWRKQ